MLSRPSATFPCFLNSFVKTSRSFQAPRSVLLAMHFSKLFTTAVYSPISFQSSPRTLPTEAPTLEPHKQRYSNKPLVTPVTSANGCLPISLTSHRPRQSPPLRGPQSQVPLFFTTSSYSKAPRRYWLYPYMAQISPVYDAILCSDTTFTTSPL